MQRIIAFLLLIFLLPLFGIICFIVKISSKGPFIYRQKRVGKDYHEFTMFKIRTMVENAELLKKNISHLNEVDGPVFKIRKDPRFTIIGKFLSRWGLDELPQLINIIKGEMAFVGPRPLPVEEAKKIPAKYSLRFNILPGITSYWVIKGMHQLSFNEWMKIDLEYVKERNIVVDIVIILTTLRMFITWVIKKYS